VHRREGGLKGIQSITQIPRYLFIYQEISFPGAFEAGNIWEDDVELNALIILSTLLFFYFYYRQFFLREEKKREINEKVIHTVLFHHIESCIKTLFQLHYPEPKDRALQILNN
jgi:hypothetical protein